MPGCTYHLVGSVWPVIVAFERDSHKSIRRRPIKGIEGIGDRIGGRTRSGRIVDDKICWWGLEIDGGCRFVLLASRFDRGALCPRRS